METVPAAGLSSCSYLHLGHVKAVMLNEHYARYYKGKLLVRFDDTNPSKETQEFATSIINDLGRLGIVPDMVSHTSDHFKLIEDFARQIIRDGLAYMDNTPVDQMRKERGECVESKNRSVSSCCLRPFSRRQCRMCAQGEHD